MRWNLRFRSTRHTLDLFRRWRVENNQSHCEGAYLHGRPLKISARPHAINTSIWLSVSVSGHVSSFHGRLLELSNYHRKAAFVFRARLGVSFSFFFFSPPFRGSFRTWHCPPFGGLISGERFAINGEIVVRVLRLVRKLNTSRTLRPSRRSALSWRSFNLGLLSVTFEFGSYAESEFSLNYIRFFFQ